MITIELMELIFRGKWTMKHCDAVAALYGRQLAARTAGHRAFARTLETGDVVRTAWRLAVRGM
jgi:hypothetical protein